MSYEHSVSGCPFCMVSDSQVFHYGEHVLAFWNPFPSTPGQALVTTRRHIDDWFSMDSDEYAELMDVISIARGAIVRRYSVDQVSVQIVAGSTVGSTSAHLHAHLTPVARGAYVPERRTPKSDKPANVITEPLARYDEVPKPHFVQREALTALDATRNDGNRAGLVVLATGLGKTWLSAFDSHRSEFKRVLFVAHREEILDQAFRTFSLIQPDARCGYYTGPRKDANADILFASVQTLGRRAHLSRFKPEHFDYVIIDEFHHAAAQSYRRILEHVQPKFLLGLTATPERMDGQDLLSLCGNNLVYQCDLRQGIERGLLVPFHYFGVPDTVQFENIPWRNGKFDEEALTTAVATQARAQNALKQYQQRAGTRTLAFCVSVRHAEFMNDYFRARGYRTVSVHSGPESAPRAESLKRLEDGELDLIFSIEMFNEGVDLPEVDTVMMLRPTESPVIWKQQLGRGLRNSPWKDHLTVIDYIGNHRLFLDRIRSLMGLGPGRNEVAEALVRFELGTADLPAGCEVTYELESIEILKGLARTSITSDRAIDYYREFRELYGVRPTASELFQAGFDLRPLRRQYGSWLRFVDQMGGLPPQASALIRKYDHFLSSLEFTAMSKSYKMLVLLAMLERDQLPGMLTVAQLADTIREFADHRDSIAQDIGLALRSDTRLHSLLVDNPIHAWSGGKATGDVTYFTLEHDHFATTRALDNLEGDQRDVFQDLTREIVDWRLAQYFTRQGVQFVQRVICTVTHKNERPLLSLPDQQRSPGIPEGPTMISVEGKRYEADVGTTTIETVRDIASGENALPEILRAWFGADAGRTGLAHRVMLELVSGRYELRPIGGDARPFELTPWQSYLRKVVPPLFGQAFSPAIWNQGIVLQEGKLILFVTLDKSVKPDNHQYEDQFINADLFQWQSQNRTTQGSRVGQTIRYHADQNVPVHLFVRRSGRDRKGRGAPFRYCGELEFLDWEGEQPITVWWKLAEPVPDELHGELSVPV